MIFFIIGVAFTVGLIFLSTRPALRYIREGWSTFRSHWNNDPLLNHANEPDWLTEDRWLEIRQIVLASELSSLANTTDNNLVIFIRQVLD